MPRIGYKLCGEEQSPQELIDCARRAEEVGFDFAMISDHYRPWIDRQGQSSFYPPPDEPPPITVAAGGSQAAELAGRIGDGLVATSPNKELKREFEKAGGKGKPCYAEMTVCWAEDEAKARGAAHEYWPTAALTGELSQVLPIPAHFEQAAKMVKEEDVAKEIVCGPDPERHLAKIDEYAEAGYDHVRIHQVGPDQEGFFRFVEKEVLPKLD